MRGENGLQQLELDDLGTTHACGNMTSEIFGKVSAMLRFYHGEHRCLTLPLHHWMLLLLSSMQLCLGIV